MKLTALFLLSACLAASAGGYSQNITITVKDAPLTKVLTEIEKQSGFNFVYGKGLIEKAGKVSLQVKEQSLAAVLELVFKNQPLDYKISENYVVLSPKETVVVQNADSPAAEVTTIDVSGRVTDADGNPLAGASVKVKGTTIGTTTDANGSYVLKGIDENSTLIFSYSEHEAQELKVGSKTSINVALVRAEGNLQEIVINKGYYTEKQRLSTGSVSTVKGEDIAKQPVANVLQALEGRVPGMFITQNSGVSGGGFSVLIRGRTSIDRNIKNNPLYVIDGVPYNSELIPATGSLVIGQGNPLNYLNPLDIESIDVLKDADATSIYGSRAANGVVLITTKKGKTGKTKIDINFYQGIGKVTAKLDLLNTEQYIQMRKEAFTNDGRTPTTSNAPDLLVWDQKRYTDWQKTLIGGTAKYTNANASVSGGNINLQYLIGGNYYRESSVFPGDFANQKAAVHFNISGSSNNQRFRALLSGNYMSDNNRLPNYDLTSVAISLPPNAPEIYDAQGKLNWANSTWSNPFTYVLQKYNATTNNLIANSLLSYQIMPGFEAKVSLGYNTLRVDAITTLPYSAIDPAFTAVIKNSSVFSSNQIQNWIVEPQLTYQLTVGKGKLNTLVGTTIQQNRANGQTLLAEGFSSDALLENMQSATILKATTGTRTQYKYNGIFGRINYNYDDKYLINLTARRDGSSRFGAGKQFGNFGAVGLGWIFSKEKFIEDILPFISYGKLRASYGITGSDLIGDYQYLALYNSIGIPYLGVNSLYPANLDNPSLQWESNKKLEAGLELGFFKDRIILNINYFQNKSSNQLISYALPMTTGFPSISSNFPAEVKNTGIEMVLNSFNWKRQNFQWQSSFNITIPKNKLQAFPDFESSSYANDLVIGQPVTIVKAYHLIGVDPQTGVYQFSDQNGNATVNPSINDRTVLVNVDPKFYGGFLNSFGYKGFSLDILFQFVKRTGLNYLTNDQPGRRGFNQPTTALNRWQKPGDVTYIQRPSQNSSISNGYLFVQNSDNRYRDASFIRLKNVSLSYSLPKNFINKYNISGCKIYVQGQNLFTITNFKGLDPESRSFNSLPPLKVLTAGIQLSL